MLKIKKVHYLFIALMSCSSILEGATQYINLRQVVKEGQHAVEALITKVGVDYQDQDGTTLAMWATCFNHRKLLRFLVNDKKADLTKQTYKTGNTALIIALGKLCNRKIDVDTINCFEEFAEKGIDIGLHVPNKAKDTPLLKAIYNIGDEEKLLKVVQSLVKSGAKVTSEFSSPNTPLVLCCDKGYKRVVEYLLSQNNRQDYLTHWKNGYDDTPLTMAATRGNLDIVQALCKKLNLDGDKIKEGIEVAVEHFHFEIAAYLISEGKKNWGPPAINREIDQLAQKGSFDTILKLLKDNKIKNAFDLTCINSSFLEDLVQKTTKERFELLNMIIEEEKVSLEEKGNMLIVEASKHGQFEIVSYLLKQPKITWNSEHKKLANDLVLSLIEARQYKLISELLATEGVVDLIDLNSQDSKQKNLLYYLIRENPSPEIDLFTLLVNAGKINLQADEKKKAFFMSCGMGNVQILQYLLDNGIDPKITNNQGQNGVMLAAWEGKEKVINLLMNKIENPLTFINLQDEKGLTALMLAKNRSTRKLLLHQYKANPNHQSEKGVTALIVVVAEALADFFFSDLVILAIEELITSSPDRSALINARDGNGMTALMVLTADKEISLNNRNFINLEQREEYKLEVVKYLVENNANTELKNNDNKTAYDFAVESNSQKIAVYLQSLAPTNIERNQNDGDNSQVGGSDNSTQANDGNSQGGVGNDNSTQADSNSQGVNNDNTTQADDSSIQANMNNYQGTNRDNSIEPNDRNNRGNNHHVPNRSSSNDSLRFLIVVGIISIIIAIAAEVPYYFENRRKKKSSSPKQLINSQVLTV